MRKLISIVAGIIILAGGFFVAQTLASTEKETPRQPEEVLQTVFTTKVKNEKVPTSVIESGVINSKNRIELYSEVQGLMEKPLKEFKPGMSFRKGEVLLKIRNDDYFANLQAQKSTLLNLVTSILPDLRIDYPDAYDKWDRYVRNFDLRKKVRPLPEPGSEKEKFFITGKNIYTTYYNTKNMELTYDKYTLSAPFDGILTESLVTPGTLVRPGQKLGEFIEPGIYEMEVAVRKSILPFLTVGKTVNVHEVDNTESNWKGEIVRINGRVNPATQTVQVFIELKDTELKEGMYLEAEITGKEEENSIEVDRNLLVNDNAVYIVEEGRLKLVPVEPVFFNERTVIIKGLEDGMELVSRNVAGGYEGMEVQVFEK